MREAHKRHYIPIRVDDELNDRLRSVALRTNRPLGAIIRECVEKALPAMEKKSGRGKPLVETLVDNC